MARAERRKEKREPVSGSLPILWQIEDGFGVEWTGQAECLDVSRFGLKLRMARALPWRSTVLFNSHKLGFGGRGVVRYCSLNKAAFEIGLECSSGVVRYLRQTDEGGHTSNPGLR